MKQLRVYEYLSRALCAVRRAPEPARAEWMDVVRRIERHCLPDGSGFDAGSTVVTESDDADRTIRIGVNFHHMDASGYYTHWSAHTVTIRATFDGFNIDVANKGGTEEPEDFLDYVADVFVSALVAPMPEDLRFKRPA